ncbi:uncharacterized protein LOC144454760 [Phascolarctos cinereus]
MSGLPAAPNRARALKNVQCGVVWFGRVGKTEFGASPTLMLTTVTCLEVSRTRRPADQMHRKIHIHSFGYRVGHQSSQSPKLRASSGNTGINLNIFVDRSGECTANCMYVCVCMYISGSLER